MKLKRHHWGGTALVARGKLIHSIEKMGVDDSGLGRWYWMQFMGKSGKSTMIISEGPLHQPMGPDSVGSQHRRYFNSIGRDVNQMDTFWINLSRLVCKWMEAGESVLRLEHLCKGGGLESTWRNSV
jgi:hypothetical protein